MKPIVLIQIFSKSNSYVYCEIFQKQNDVNVKIKFQSDFTAFL